MSEGEPSRSRISVKTHWPGSPCTSMHTAGVAHPSATEDQESPGGPGPRGARRMANRAGMVVRTGSQREIGAKRHLEPDDALEGHVRTLSVLDATDHHLINAGDLFKSGLTDPRDRSGMTQPQPELLELIRYIATTAVVHRHTPIPARSA